MRYVSLILAIVLLFSAVLSQVNGGGCPPGSTLVSYGIIFNFNWYKFAGISSKLLILFFFYQ